MTDSATDPPQAAPAGASDLVVSAAPPTDAGRGIARLHPGCMAGLGLRPGDTVAIRGGRASHARVLPLAPERPGGAGDPDRGRIGLCALGRENCCAAPGDTVSVEAITLPEASSVVLRAERADAVPPAALHEALLERPLTLSDRVTVIGGPGAGDYTVAAVAPEPAGRVGPGTVLRLEATGGGGRPYAGIGGLRAQIARVREMVELPLRRPELFARLGIAPPRGVLFTGPPGSGKTLLARAVATGSGLAFFHIDGPEIVSKHYGESEAKLRAVFRAAEREAPSVLFIDEIDAVAPRRDTISGDRQLERRLVAQLLTLMDGLEDRGRVVLIAATNLAHLLDPALRRPGRFDREVAFTAPDRGARRDILGVHFDPIPRTPDADLDALADDTEGYVGADLAALAREAGMAALRRLSRVAGSVEAVALADVAVCAEDLAEARLLTGPSALRETRVELPRTRWSDIGGLAEAKQALAEAVLWPRIHAAAVRALGLRPPSGILLSGPPGGGKTLLARALAAESGMNFVAVRGGRLLSQYLGEAERRIAELFERARHAAPCLLFFDEIDAIAPARGTADQALSRVVAQLLVEIDGIEGSRGLMLLGATNRVGAIDPALLRPGRFDLVIEIPRPDAASRREILAVHLRGMPLGACVDVDALARDTPGWSGADLAALCQGAARMALRRAVAEGAAEAAARLAVTATDFTAALEQRRQSDAARDGAALPKEDG